jgi:protein-disulfide isomerase
MYQSGMNVRDYVAALTVTVLLLLCVPAFAQTSDPANTERQTSDTPTSSAVNPNSALEQTIHDYILAHPEVLVESLKLAKQKQQERFAAVIKSRIVAFRKDLLEDPSAPVLGNPKGDVTLVEFFDYRCPYCRQMEPWLQTLIKEDPGVRLVQKQFPILGPTSVYAAHVALAAMKQGKHTAFHDALMAKEGKIDERDIHEDLILQAAESVGLDMDRMKADMKSPDVEAEIQRSVQIAKSLGLTGTPAFVVGKELLPGATDLETLKSMVDDARHDLD